MSRRALWASVGTALLVFGGLNLLATAYLDRHPENRAYWIIKEKWRRLGALKAPLPWMLLGDSTCNQGLVPAVWNRELQTRSMNLCTIGNALSVDDVWMLEEHIERLGPPQHVLLMHVYDMWPRRLELRLLGQVPRPYGFWAHHRPRVALPAAMAGDFMRARYLPLYGQAVSLRKAARRALTQPASAFDSGFHMGADGYMPWPSSNPGLVRQDFGEHRRMVRRRRFAMSALNRAALHRLAALADAHGFDVYLSTGPMFEGGLHDPALRRYLDALFAELGRWASSSPRLHVLTEVEGYPADAMLNFDHAIHPTALDFTARVARRIRARM